MEKEIKTYHPTLEKTFSLEDLLVPPKKYSQFLNKCVDEFVSFVLQLNKSGTIEEAQKKYKKKFNRLNHKKRKEESPLLPFVDISMKSKLEFSKLRSHKRIYEYEQLTGKENGPSININNYKKEIKKNMGDFEKALDERYPNRKNKMSIDNLSGFELSLFLRSVWSLLETKVILCNQGFRGDGYFIVGIKLETNLVSGSFNIPKKMLNNLEKILNVQYQPITSVSYKKSYYEF